MNKGDPNVISVELVAAALNGLRERLVFVGGSTTGLLISNPGRPAVRATRDVDLIAEVTSKVEYYELADELKRLGFKEVMEVNCRWKVRDIIVDVMPTDEEVLGFSNRWYGEAVENAITLELPSSTKIKIISPPYFLATKLEAFHGRGNNDYGSSHDIEDLVVLVDGREEIVGEVHQSNEELSSYLITEIGDLLEDETFVEAIPWHFHPDLANQGRIEQVILRLRAIANI